MGEIKNFTVVYLKALLLGPTAKLRTLKFMHWKSRERDLALTDMCDRLGSWMHNNFLKLKEK